MLQSHGAHGGPDSFDLVIADGELPDGNSKSLVTTLQSAGQPVLVCSGNSDMRLPGIPFMGKPVLLAELVKTAQVLISTVGRKAR